MEEATWADAIVSVSSGLYHTFSLEECLSLAPKPMYDLASPADLPDSPNVIRKDSLGVDEPEKERVVAYVRAEAEKVLAEYRDWLERSALAFSLAMKFVSSSTFWTLMRFFSVTVGSLLMTLDTVVLDTPACAAISIIVSIFFIAHHRNDILSLFLATK